jgi:hypothetical protein
MTRRKHYSSATVRPGCGTGDGEVNDLWWLNLKLIWEVLRGI